MTRISRVLFVALIAIAQSALARLGENETQCDIRYGTTGKLLDPDLDLRMNPLVAGDNTTNRLYLYQGWNIKIGFINGIASKLRYSKAEGNLSQRKITPAEVQAVLSANSSGQTWTRSVRSELVSQGKLMGGLIGALPGEFWIRNDRAVGYLLPGEIRFHLETYFSLKRDAAMKQQKERESKKPIPQF